MTNILLVVAAALINSKNEVLLASRPKGKALAGLWEFPGGKIDAGETPEQALVRELSEEIGVIVREDSLKSLTFVSYNYPDFNLLMPIWVIRDWEGVAKALENQELAWVSSERLDDYSMPPADEPLREFLKDYLRNEQIRKSD